MLSHVITDIKLLVEAGVIIKIHEGSWHRVESLEQLNIETQL